MNVLAREMPSPFGGLITSKTRVQILMRLFLNPARRAYLRELASEFGTSPSLVRDELNQLAEAGLLHSERSGRQLLFRANTDHSLFPELNSMVRKAFGMDHIVESIVSRLGELESAWLIDDYAKGQDSGLIDLVLVGDIHQDNLADLVAKAERYLDRKIRTLVLGKAESGVLDRLLAERPHLPLWRDGTAA